MNTTFDDLLAHIEDLQKEVKRASVKTSPTDLSLDYRCGHVWVGTDFIASEHPNMLDYFGGFEYVAPEFVCVIGSMKVYSSESERVFTCLEN